MNARRRLAISVAILPLALALLMLRGELRLRAGESFRVPIRGFDPRDLLHGHYLLYAYDFAWRGQSSCGSPQPGAPSRIDPACCVCLTRAARGQPAPARQVDCAATSACDAWLAGKWLQPPQRYFVPEAHASALEQALREQAAALDLVATGHGQPVLGELYLNGRPWREATGPATTASP